MCGEPVYVWVSERVYVTAVILSYLTFLLVSMHIAPIWQELRVGVYDNEIMKSSAKNSTEITDY